MKAKTFIFNVVFAIALAACNTVSEEKKQELPVQDATMTFGTEKVTFPKLSEKARNEVIQWSVFEDFENEVRNVNGANISELMSGTERLIVFTDSLPKSVPETLNTQLILSRMIVAKTRAELLYQEVRLSRLDSANIATSIKELNIATQNVLTQIEEKFAKEQIDTEQIEETEKERLQQERFLDSVYQAELRDKNDN